MQQFTIKIKKFKFRFANNLENQGYKKVQNFLCQHKIIMINVIRISNAAPKSNRGGRG